MTDVKEEPRAYSLEEVMELCRGPAWGVDIFQREGYCVLRVPGVKGELRGPLAAYPLFEAIAQRHQVEVNEYRRRLLAVLSLFEGPSRPRPQYPADFQEFLSAVMAAMGAYARCMAVEGPGLLDKPRGAVDS